MIFFKYHGTGNDFIIIDNRENIFVPQTATIEFLCQRHFGVGSDGLILLNKHQKYDFEFKFYNPDGTEADFCGNGARCIVAFAKYLKIIETKTTFIANDGVHYAFFQNDEVVLKMANVSEITEYTDMYSLNTGTQHAVKFVQNIDKIDIIKDGRSIRNNNFFAPIGTNVNFVEIKKNQINVRTYEKGVEHETLSCGTGVVASALAFAIKNNIKQQIVNVNTKGGKLKVIFNKKNNMFTDVFLQANAKLIFKGETL